MGGKGSGPTSEIDPVLVVAQYRSGQPMSTIAREYGVSRQRIHQIIQKEVGPTAARSLSAEVVTLRRNQKADLARLDEVLRRLALDRRCLLCGAVVLRGDYYQTCSPKCAQDWRDGGRLADPDNWRRHRETQARSILRYPENHSESQIHWANRVLSDDPPPVRGRWNVRGSKASKAKANFVTH